jgi:hypothetical protein
MLKSPGLKLRRVFAGWEVDRCISVATNEGTIADIPGIGNISPVGTFGVSSASLEEGTESEDELIPFMEKTGLKNEFCSVLEPFKAISPKMEEGSLNDSFPSPSYKLCHCILCLVAKSFENPSNDGAAYGLRGCQGRRNKKPGSILLIMQYNSNMSNYVAQKDAGARLVKISAILFDTHSAIHVL